MYVTQIEIIGFDATETGEGCAGSVALIADDTCVHIPLTVARRVEIDTSRDRLRLLAQALQQARRLPGYGKSLRFAPGILPPELCRKRTLPPSIELAKRRRNA